MRIVLGSRALARISALILLTGIACARSSSAPPSAAPSPPVAISERVPAAKSKVDSIAASPSPVSTSAPAQLRIRCGNTISLDHPPLYVLDGVPLGLRPDSTIDHEAAAKALAGVDPKSIVSISVLKEIDETAHYGPGAHAGVVLITTSRKKAKSP
jgi:hypothetical protein